jgi:ClpP class serine protease
MAADKAEFERVQAIVQRVAAARDADILLYSGDIERPYDDKVIEMVTERSPRRKNVLLVLCTYGGDPNAAYRIARCLQKHYQGFTAAVAGFCKSAGTLVLLGANSLMLLENAELGPLDVQLRKSDELEEFASGLTPTQAIATLTSRSLETFTQNFLQL